MGKRDPQHNINLGKLQDEHSKARANLKKARTLLDNANQQFDYAQAAFDKAKDQLANALRTVIR